MNVCFDSIHEWLVLVLVYTNDKRGCLQKQVVPHWVATCHSNQ
jgi:hypothetical protein